MGAWELVHIDEMYALQVVYCARARTSSIEDVKLVEEEGVVRLAVELQVPTSLFHLCFSEACHMAPCVLVRLVALDLRLLFFNRLTPLCNLALADWRAACTSSYAYWFFSCIYACQ